jgi:hypothetical protein
MGDFFGNPGNEGPSVTQLSIPANENSIRFRCMEAVNKGNRENE